MRVNPIPPIKVVPVPEQKFFEARDGELLEERLEKARAKAWAKPDAKDPLTFSKAWSRFIAAAINAQGTMVALATKRHLAERDARIAALMTAVELRDAQIERHAQHLARLQTRIEALERFKADK